MINRLLLFILAAMLIHGGHAKAEDDTYKIGKISLIGWLRTKTFYGPPDYGEHPKTDEHEDEYVLIVTGDPTIQDRKAGRHINSNVMWLELVVYDNETKTADQLMDKCVVVDGILSYAETAHYHTPLAIDVKSIEAWKKQDCD